MRPFVGRDVRRGEGGGVSNPTSAWFESGRWAWTGARGGGLLVGCNLKGALLKLEVEGRRHSAPTRPPAQLAAPHWRGTNDHILDHMRREDDAEAENLFPEYVGTNIFLR